MVRALGIDLSGRTSGTTALAVADGPAGRAPTVTIQRSHQGRRLPRRPALRRMADVAADLDVGIVAIDAPLGFPHAWTCEDDDCARCFPEDGDDGPYTIRDAEHAAAWVLATGHEVRPMPTSMLGALAARGVYLRRAVGRHGIATLETWPAGVLVQLAGEVAPRPSSSKDPDGYAAWARALLEEVVDAAWDDVHGPDEADAVAAAFAGWVHLTRAGCVHVGGDATICVPATTR